MRKLAPTILAASIAALAGGALADTGTMSTTDKVTSSPTVDTNTNNPQGMSYTDKSTTSPGTNAKIDDTQPQSGKAVADNAKPAKKMKHKAKLAKNTQPVTNSSSVDGTNGAADNSTTGTSTGR